MILDAYLKKNPVKCEHAVTFMKRILDAENGELAPTLKKDEEFRFWFLTIFSVYHPKNLIKSEWSLTHQLSVMRCH